MSTQRSLSGYIFGGIAATLLAIGVCGIPLTLVSADHFSRHSSQATAKASLSDQAAKTKVDRSRKGDRLPLARTSPVANTAVIRKNVVAPADTVHGVPMRPRTLEIDEGKGIPRLTPAPMLYCEPMASPVSDPILGGRNGRCFA
jgi:hypothetical protein